MTDDTPLVFPAAHPALAGHFPGLPIVPGVLLLDAAIHALECQGKVVSGVASAKFLQIVGPDQPLTLTWTAGDTARAGFEIRSAGQRAASGTLLIAPPMR
jgi:3-hydroxymyristoyl/3-hydroxydecanoyl-(acyl carrier protein) dehydratase